MQKAKIMIEVVESGVSITVSAPCRKSGKIIRTDSYEETGQDEDSDEEEFLYDNLD